MQVYYCPQMSFKDQASPPLLFTFFPLFRNILLRERVDIVHGHQVHELTGLLVNAALCFVKELCIVTPLIHRQQATSALAHECILHARTMGYRAVYTDHSLFGFANAGAIHLNKVLKFSLR